MHTATPCSRSTAATSSLNHDRWRSSSACPTPGHSFSVSQNSASLSIPFSGLHWKLLGTCQTTAASLSRSGWT